MRGLIEIVNAILLITARRIAGSSNKKRDEREKRLICQPIHDRFGRRLVRCLVKANSIGLSDTEAQDAVH